MGVVKNSVKIEKNRTQKLLRKMTSKFRKFNLKKKGTNLCPKSIFFFAVEFHTNSLKLCPFVSNLSNSLLTDYFEN